MSKLFRAAQTSQSLSLAAMEEASRLDLREADIEHLFLALVINDQPAGLALRSLGITIDTARLAVTEQHEAQLASLGIDRPIPRSGRITFHETGGYEWSTRAQELIACAGKRGKAGDAAAVLRELVAEPSGFMADILGRLNTTPAAVVASLEEAETPAGNAGASETQMNDRTAASTDAFISAPVEAVWEFLTDPSRVPEWEPQIGVVNHVHRDSAAGTTFSGTAVTMHPDGRPIKVKPQFRRRSLEIVSAERPRAVS